ncbi:MAG: M20/M25/M40 family metallo-hydrolase, partial [Candidatus Aenigmatarchaeota archaeon]
QKNSLVIIGDVTNFDLVVSEKGILWLELISYGKEAHASMPWTGVNALEKLNKVLYHIQNMKIEGKNELLGNSTISITIFNSGIKTNVIPGIAKAQLDIRLIPEEKKEAIIDLIREIINRLSEEDKNMKIEIKELLYYPPVKPSYDEKTIKIIQESIRSVLNKEPKIVGEHGATGAGYFISNGFPCIVFGPGKPENCHIKDEYIEIKDLVNAAKIYKEIIRNFLK